MSEFAIQTQGLTKQYAAVQALSGMNLNVPRGAVYGFLGRNGAGKTSTIKILLGLSRATRGMARVLDLDPRTQTIEVLSRVGFVSERKALFDELTGEQLVRFNRGFFPTWSEELAQKYIRIFEIPIKQRFGELSLGNRTKLCLLLALAQGADVLVLDEPTIGLDPVMADLLMSVLIEDHATQGRTIFFSSHHLEEVERICDWVGVVEAGKLLLETRLDDLRTNFRLITARGSAPPIVGYHVVNVHQQSDFYRFVVRSDADEFVGYLRNRGMSVMQVSTVTLSDAFLGLVRKESHVPAEMLAAKS